MTKDYSPKTDCNLFASEYNFAGFYFLSFCKFSIFHCTEG